VAPLVPGVGHAEADGARGAGGLAVVVAVGVVVLWPRADRITKENLGRIRLGMSAAEVEVVLGPPGDYRSGRGESHWGHDGWLADSEPRGRVGLAQSAAVR
jgi:hypothetical protein